MDLLKPILVNENLISKVDYDFSINLNIFLNKIDFTYFSSIPEIDNEIDNYRKQNNSFGSVSKFYFYYLESLRFFQNRILDYVEDLSRRIQYLKKQIASGGAQAKLMEQFVQNMESEFILNKVYLEDQDFTRTLNQLFESYF